MHVLDSLTQELLTLNMELIQTADSIMDGILDLLNILVSLQFTTDSKHYEYANK